MQAPRSPLLRYGAPIPLIALALLLARALHHFTEPGTHAPFYAAVMLSAWLGGLGPGLFATLLSSMAIDYFVESPMYSLGLPTGRTAISLLAFALTALLISGLDAQRRAAFERAAHAYMQADEARREAEEATRVRDQVLASVSHDLRSPLAAIAIFAQLARRQARRSDAAARDQVDENLARIAAAVAKIGRLIDEQVDLARMQSGKRLTLQRETMDLVALARATVAEYQGMSEQHCITIETTVPTLIGEWDAMRLERTLANLLGNAIKYSPEGGPVRLAIAREDGTADAWAVIRIEDRGIGIPADDLPYLFAWFYRAANAEGQINGTGLGLAGARDIIEQHGGTIDVASAEGAGTAITVRLPLGKKSDR